MAALPAFIFRAREIQECVGDDRGKFVADFEKIYPETTNFDEKTVPAFELPSLLVYPDGRRVRTAAEWMQYRRPEILQLFKEEIYGEALPRPDAMRFELLSQKEGALDGLAVRKEIRICCSMKNGREFSFDMLLYLPVQATGPVPCFLGLNFKGNHGCTTENDVLMTPVRFNDGTVNVITNATPEFFDESSRGIHAHRWCIPELIKRGYAAVTACYEDIFPDEFDCWEHSCVALFGDFAGFRGCHEKFSAIGAWAWGISRMMDYLQTSPLIDSSRVALHGHSRLGKTALWAGALDQRFKLVISNDSGCLGAALSYRRFGENFLILLNYRPHWFVKNARRFINRESEMPFDQHFLLSLIAPRPVAVASAVDDTGADPYGEFLSAFHAQDVYKLFGSAGLPLNGMPREEGSCTGDISYHIRQGGHDQTPVDWAHYLEIADLYL